jgi:5-methylcytosine-specific restriction endonuclease McrA
VYGGRRRVGSRGGTVAGRPARPLFATPGIAAAPAPRPGDYKHVIHSANAPGQPCAARTLTAMGRALVLNATELPLAVVPARRAVVLVLKEKAEVVQSNGAIFHSEWVAMEAPSVVRLRHFVHVPFRAHAPLTRRAVFARDAWRCQYCGAAAENLDHVLPRSRGGLHVWENVVAACRRCNAKKMDRTPQEAGFHLHRQPFAPSDGFRLTLGQVEPGWEPYLI